jgi:c(7)-type cytochrome triheme protein
VPATTCNDAMKLFATVLLVPLAFVWQMVGLPAAPRVADDSDVIFSHRYHLDEEDLACADCHDGVEASLAGTDNLLPTMDTCGTCHDVEAEDNCVQCHRNAEDPAGFPLITDYSQKFAHAVHVPAGLECSTCHEAVLTKEEYDGRSAIPTMVGCVDCHDDRAVESECATCHLPEDELLPSSHLVGFVRAHSDLARRGAHSSLGDKTCATCHQDEFCQDCHEGENLDRLSHPLNYEFPMHSTPSPVRWRARRATPTPRSVPIATGRTN